MQMNHLDCDKRICYGTGSSNDRLKGVAFVDVMSTEPPPPRG
jgi:hypothetical protein